jgi:ADP-ribose pyrophosphatase YjhB (NUDIX family)
MNAKTYSAGGVVVNKVGDILLVQEYSLYWGLPRGHLEKNELALDAAIREIAEEAGLNSLQLIRKLGSYERYRFDEEGKEIRSELKHMTFFLFTALQEEPRPQDHAITAAEWVRPQKVAERLTNEIDRKFYETHLAEIEEVASSLSRLRAA